jgi:4-hydroxy-tetrahydrodipicolinate synthase
MFRGVYTVLVTPFNSADEVDYEGLRRNVEWQIQEGINGLVVNGSTSEFASLEDYEREKTAATVLNTVAGKIPVLVGASAETTQKAIYYAKSAKESGAQGVLVLPPYYYKPNQEEIFRHFALIADAVDVPIMIYNNPFTTGVDIQPETVKRMVDYHSNLSYIKECTGDIKRLRQLQLLCGDKIKIFCGWEDLAFESFLMNASGWISVIGNITPKLAVELFVEVAEKKNFDKGWKIYKSMLPMLQFLEYRGKAPQTLKYCLERIGLVGGTVRLPRLPLSDEDKRDIDEMLKGIGLL